MDKDTYLTIDGEKRLRAELENLSGPVREQISKRLRIAIQQGDLSENADYISTKEEQGFVEGRIQELENLLKHVIIIDELKKQWTVVDIGCTVTLQEGNFPPETYFLVGPQEANPKNGRISYESPFGKALLKHRVGEIVEAETPQGNIKLSILKIE
jgi:transcription elongation factor GreA